MGYFIKENTAQEIENTGQEIGNTEQYL